MMRQQIWKYSLPAHNQIKSSILECIDKSKKEKRIGTYEQITFTDWNNPQKFIERDYVKIMSPHLVEFFEILDKRYYAAEHDTTNGWFQQYIKTDRHDWHFHAHTHFACVYFVELNDSKDSTQFYVNDKIYQPKVKEGDILVFPGFVPHRSPNLADVKNRKTIISFNLDIVHPSLL